MIDLLNLTCIITIWNYSISCIVKSLDTHSSAVIAIGSITTAIATVILTAVTWRNIQEIKFERKYQRRIKHTERLKEEVIKPWIKELEEIKLPNKTDNIFKRDRGEYYNGDKLKVEDVVLFRDLRNHIGPDVFENYENFKEEVEILWNKIDNFEKKVEVYLTSRINLQEYNKATLKKYGEFFDLDTPRFFLTSLFFKLVNNNIELKPEEWKEDIRITCRTYSNEQKSESCLYYLKKEDYEDIDKLKNSKIPEIESLLKNLLKELNEKFRTEVDEIHNLIDKIKKDKEELLKKLQEIKEVVVFEGECKYI